MQHKNTNTTQIYKKQNTKETKQNKTKNIYKNNIKEVLGQKSYTLTEHR
jgi:hypothetical protein